MIFYRDKFKEKRVQLRYSSSKLAEKCKVTKSTINRWERGINCPPEAYIRMLADILNISVNEISDLPDNKQNPFLENIKEFNMLANLEKENLQEKEDYFIACIKKQRRQVEKTDLVINSILTAMHSIFYIKNTSNKYVLVNNDFLKLTVNPKSTEIEGKDDFFFFQKIEAAGNARIDQNVLDLKEKFLNKQMYILGTRKKRWGLITKVPILSNKNKVEGMLCIIKDITEEKKANELNQELHSAINNINDVIWTAIKINNKIEITTINKAVKNLLGLNQKQFIKNEWKKNVHPDSLEVIKKYLRDKRSNQKEVEYKYIHPLSGKTLWLQNRLNTDGNYYFGIIRDITDQKEAEETRILLENALNISNDGIWIAKCAKEHGQDKYFYINSARSKIYEQDINEMLENIDFWKNNLHPDDYKRVIAESEDMTPGKKGQKFRLLFNDGRIKYIIENKFVKTINNIKYSGGIQKEVSKEIYDQTIILPLK